MCHVIDLVSFIIMFLPLFLLCNTAAPVHGEHHTIIAAMPVINLHIRMRSEARLNPRGIDNTH